MNSSRQIWDKRCDAMDAKEHAHNSEAQVEASLLHVAAPTLLRLLIDARRFCPVDLQDCIDRAIAKTKPAA